VHFAFAAHFFSFCGHVW